MKHYAFSFPNVGSMREHRLIAMDPSPERVIRDVAHVEHELADSLDAGVGARAEAALKSISDRIAPIDERIAADLTGRLETRRKARNDADEMLKTRAESMAKGVTDFRGTLVNESMAGPTLNDSQTALANLTDARFKEIVSITELSYTDLPYNAVQQIRALAENITALRDVVTENLPEDRVAEVAPALVVGAPEKKALNDLIGGKIAREQALNKAVATYSANRSPENLQALRKVFRSNADRLYTAIETAATDRPGNAVLTIVEATNQLQALQNIYDSARVPLTVIETPETPTDAFRKRVTETISSLGATPTPAILKTASERLASLLPLGATDADRKIMRDIVDAAGYDITITGTTVSLSRRPIEGEEVMARFRANVDVSINKLTPTSTVDQINGIQNELALALGDAIPLSRRVDAINYILTRAREKNYNAVTEFALDGRATVRLTVIPAGARGFLDEMRSGGFADFMRMVVDFMIDTGVIPPDRGLQIIEQELKTLGERLGRTTPVLPAAERKTMEDRVQNLTKRRVALEPRAKAATEAARKSAATGITGIPPATAKMMAARFPGTTVAGVPGMPGYVGFGFPPGGHMGVPGPLVASHFASHFPGGTVGGPRGMTAMIRPNGTTINIINQISGSFNTGGGVPMTRGPVIYGRTRFRGRA